MSALRREPFVSALRVKNTQSLGCASGGDTCGQKMPGRGSWQERSPRFERGDLAAESKGVAPVGLV